MADRPTSGAGSSSMDGDAPSPAGEPRAGPDDTLRPTATGLADDGLAAEDPEQTPAATLGASEARHAGALIDEALGGAPTVGVGPSTILRPGMRLWHYEIERRLGAGGMGEVFAARYVATGEVVALKTLSSATATRLYRFKREFRALADVTHRNLIGLRELVVPQDGLAFFTMELLDGEPFVRWVRGSLPPGALPEGDRLEEGLRQLVEGVHHLHEQGCIHRDLKPSNVLVTTEGRVVVLDFGLVSELHEPDRGVTRDRQILGTPSYMAPEQALGQRAGPAADFYAIGVMLFEALTGRLPHEGGALQQLVAKHDTTVDPGIDVAGMPEHLRRLCTRLLARDPEARPSARELLAQLHAPSQPVAEPTSVFVGRTEELRMLHAALAEVAEREGPVVAHLRGRSGDGKSALVRRFRSELRAAEVVVLHGRCREQETVPYKGFDAIVDDLSAYLRRLPADEQARLCPPDLDALVRLFPVLDELWEPPEPQNLGTAEVRKLGGVTLRKLLRAVADVHPLVVHIDDFQWADPDSVSLLEAIVRPPESPSMLLLLSYRSEAEHSEALRELLGNDLLAGSRARKIELGPLSATDARTLASALLRGVKSGALSRQAEAIALRSRGSPFFIAQLVLGGDERETADADLDQVVVRRLSELDHESRRLLEFVAVFGGPVDVVLACELSEAREAVVGSLCALGLLVRDQPIREGSEARIETVHDRVREVAAAGLDPDDRALLHLRIGERMLAGCGGAPEGDAIFSVVDHLAAGTRRLETLPQERREELARLGCSAGQRALETGAWVLARRYFQFSFVLVEPMLAAAREGNGPRPLCVEIVFGRAQAMIMLEDIEGDGVMQELLMWSLSKSDHIRISRWYCMHTALRADFERSVAVGVDALAHFGLRAARRPSWPRALVSYARGWLSIWRAGIERVRAIPMVDESLGMAMDIVAVSGGWGAVVDLRVHLDLIGLHGRMLTKHGAHDWMVAGLISWAMSAGLLGRISKARSLLELAEALAGRPEISVMARFSSHAMLLSISPMCRPVRDIVDASETELWRVGELAPQRSFELMGSLCANNHYLAGTPIPRIEAFLDAFEAKHDGFSLPWTTQSVAGYRHHWQMLQAYAEGRDELEGGLTKPTNPQIAVAMDVWLIERAFLLGEREIARRVTNDIEQTIHRDAGPSWILPFYAVFSVMVMAEHWQDATSSQRRRFRRSMRRRRVVARRWARRCPENYGPMLDIIDGELAALEDRYESALLAYERARTVASEQRSHRFVGLACERLAKLAQRRGQVVVATGGFDAALEAYRAWGATAVARRLERERLQGRSA